MTDALVFLVVAPIVAALLPIVFGIVSERAGWPVAAVASVVQLGLSLVVLERVVTDGAFNYEVGGFQPPMGIELVADGVSAPLLVLVAAVTVGVVAYAHRAGPHTNAFYTELLLLTAGISGVVATGDVFNLYVFLEITGLATYALVASGDSPSAAVASLKYLLIGTIGASFYLLGVGYLYVATGTLNMADLSTVIASVGYDSPLVLTGFGLMTLGLLVKAAIFPLHTWQPGAYAESPDSVSAYISALVSTAAAYALFRIVYAVFTLEFFAAVPVANDFLMLIASLSVVAGSVFAVMQSDPKRMLAYSSVSQFGLVVAAIGVANQTAAEGALVHLIGHAVMKGGLFLTVGVITTATGARVIDDFAGLADRVPVASAAFAVLGFAMVGVPPAIGFAGKWNILVGAVIAEEWLVAAVAVVSTVLTLAYFARIVERMYFASPEGVEDESAGREPTIADGGTDTAVSFGMRAVVVGAAVVAVVLGFVASDLIALFDPVLEVYFA